MSPIDYWYKKYIALKECERIPKPELTWEDVKEIVRIADYLMYSAEALVDTENRIGIQQYYEEVLQRFNEHKEDEK